MRDMVVQRNEEVSVQGLGKRKRKRRGERKRKKKEKKNGTEGAREGNRQNKVLKYIS